MWTISHDFAHTPGGAEWVTGFLANEVLPASRLICISGSAEAFSSSLGGVESNRFETILSARLGPASSRLLAPLVPAISRTKMVQGNLLASSYAFAHQVNFTGQMVVYCHSPLRQLYSGSHNYAAAGSAIERIGLRLSRRALRRADQRAAARASAYVATSRAVARRIRSAYGFDPVDIIPPPYDDQQFFIQDAEKEIDLLWAGRIVEPYKQLGLVLETMKLNPRRHLTVVGDGRDRRRLEASAPTNVSFVGWRARSALAEMYQTAALVIFPSEDDYGLVPVEAIACGVPVVAYGKGGALDTVRPTENGALFYARRADAVSDAIREASSITADRRKIASSVHHLRTASFKSRMSDLLATFDE